MRHVSDGIYSLLMSQGIAAGERAGTRKLARKIARTAGTGAASVKGPGTNARPVYREVMRQTDSEGETTANLMEPSPARSRPVLRLVVSNKCLPRETPMRGPRNSLGRHLVLV